jgi:hypothetical protein
MCRAVNAPRRFVSVARDDRLTSRACSDSPDGIESPYKSRTFSNVCASPYVYQHRVVRCVLKARSAMLRVRKTTSRVVRGRHRCKRRRTSRPVSRVLYPALAHRAATIHLGLPSPRGSSGLPAGSGGSPSIACANPLVSQVILLDLAPGGVYRAAPVTRNAGGLLHHRFTLTGRSAGGLFSVALSRESPRVAVSNHPALWSPDFPRRTCCQVRRGRPVGSSAATTMLAGE